MEDKIKGLDQGADDYLSKPFDVNELIARLRVNETSRQCYLRWRRIFNAMMAAVSKLKDALSMEEFDSTEAHMKHCADNLCPLMLEVRSHADALELVVSDDLYPYHLKMLSSTNLSTVKSSLRKTK